MRFAGLILNDYNFVKDSGIEKISVTFTEKVQVIIGSNGSGKSAILRQLDPYPAVRSSFGKQGFKSQIIEHDGVYYRLESEYEKPSSPHAFYQGDSEENLNVGRTTPTQQELIVEHLGVTPLVSDLIMNRYVLPKWGIAERKKFLMGANPDQIGFILAEVKKIASDIKSCKNNISRLQARKIQLEQELLDSETVETLTKEKEVIGEDLAAFQQNLMDLEVGLRTLPSSSSSFSPDLRSVQKTIKRYHYQLSSLSRVERDDHQRQRTRESVISKIAICEQRLLETDEEIDRHSAELSDMETRYRELDVGGDLQLVENTISRLEMERDKLQISRPPFELSSDDLSVRYDELDTLRNQLHLFDSIDIPLLPSKKRQQRERALSSGQYKQNSYRMRLSDLETQYADLSKRHKISPEDIPDSPCAKNRCPLYSHFMGEYQQVEEKRQRVRQSIEKGRRKTDRLDRYVTALIDQRQRAQPYIDRIQWLVGQAQNNPILHHVLRHMDILAILSTNPNRITRQLQDEYDRIAQWLRLKAVLSDLETAYALKNRKISSESHDTIKLVTHITEKKEILTKLRTVITDTLSSKKILEKRLNDITLFSDIKSAMLEIQASHQRLLDTLAQGYEKDRLKLLQRGVEDLRTKHFIRMSDIERTLKSQSSLRERYQEEVISQIAIIEKELSDLQQIEAALLAIPNESMISFINSVFDQANRLIETIWTIPLKIELLRLDDPLTYEFKVRGDNQSIREMSECSEGQTEILSLAINLSLRIILRHFNYPLCLDESARTFDEKHKQNFILLLKRLLDDKIISQLFYVSHHAMIHEGFPTTETLVIRDDNILLPEKYNEHATIS